MISAPAYLLVTGRRWATHIPSLAIAGLGALPFCLLLFPNAGEAAFLLVSLAGLWSVLHNRPTSGETYLVFIISFLPLLFFGIAVLSVVVSGDYTGWYHPLKKLAELLATPFIAILLLRISVDPKLFSTVAKTTVLLLFMVALYQSTIMHNPRPGGAISPLQFGHVMLLLGYFSLIRVPMENKQQQMLSLTAFAAGYMATLLTQSRIEWINAFVLFPVLIVTWKRAGLLSNRIIWTVSILLSGLILFSFSTNMVQSRVDSAMNEYESYFDQATWNSSVGQRLLMWTSGLRAAARKPVFGWGIHRSQQAAVAELQDPAARRKIVEHHNLHNEYVNTLVAKGIVGLVSLLALLIIPLSVFLVESTDPDLLVYNAGGALLCVSYAISGFTYQAFGDDTMNVFFVIVFCYTLSAVISGTRRAANGSTIPR